MNAHIYFPVYRFEDDTLERIARYVYKLDIEFYSILSTNLEIAIAKIIRSLKDPGSDLGAGYAVLENSTPVGYLSYFPLHQKMTRNLASLKAMLDLSDPISIKIAKNTKQFHNLLAPIQAHCHYLNKIVIFDEYAGKSFGKMAFEKYLMESDSVNLAPMFHVRSDNEGAMRFYSKFGFSVESSEFRYLLCKKN